MLNGIPFQRALAYLVGLCLLPALFFTAAFFSNRSYLDDVEERLDTVEQLALTQEKRQAQNLTVINHFKDADHFYIDKRLESVHPLEPEVEALQKIVAHKNFTDDEEIKKRLDFLTGGGNSLRFTEGVVQTFPQFQETTETLIHPVEVNLNDVQRILALVEGVKVGTYEPAPERPQLIILDFKLDKKKIHEKNEVYLMNMKLLKREFL